MTPVQKNKSPIGAFFFALGVPRPNRPYPIKGADCTAENPVLTDHG
jgi:hypothetical protein